MGLPSPFALGSGPAARRLYVGTWTQNGPLEIFPSNSDQLLEFSSSLQRAAAVNRESRFLVAERLAKQIADWPGLLALLVHYYIFYEDSPYRLAPRRTDPAFDGSWDAYARFLAGQDSTDLPVEEKYWPGARIASTWVPIGPLSAFSAPSLNLGQEQALLAQWRSLSAENGKRYLRYNLIQSNEIEGVFHLGSAAALGLLVLFQLNVQQMKRLRCLTRVGLFENAVVHIESDSLILKSDSIVRVLQNSTVALQMISKVACGELPLNIASCCELISRETRFFSVDTGDGIPSTVALWLSALRGEPSFTTLPADENVIVEFAPHYDLPALFEGLIATIRDGDGRLGRMIASLPLLRIQGPPLLIVNSQRESYLNALEAVKATSDLSPLIFLLDGIELGPHQPR